MTLKKAIDNKIENDRVTRAELHTAESAQSSTLIP